MKRISIAVHLVKQDEANDAYTLRVGGGRTGAEVVVTKKQLKKALKDNLGQEGDYDMGINTECLYTDLGGLL